MKSLLTVLALLLAACTSSPGTVHHVAEGAIGPYSGAVESGEIVFLAGKIGPREATSLRRRPGRSSGSPRS